jgi:hypothetical protein
VQKSRSSPFNATAWESSSNGRRTAEHADYYGIATRGNCLMISQLASIGGSNERIAYRLVFPTMLLAVLADSLNSDEIIRGSALLPSRNVYLKCCSIATARNERLERKLRHSGRVTAQPDIAPVEANIRQREELATNRALPFS